MPRRAFQTGKKSTSSTARIFTGLRLGKADEKTKVVKASQIHEQRKWLEERKKNEERRKFQVTTTHIVDLFTTGLSALMHQKIAELGMTANRELGAIDWEIIPDTSIHNDSMDVDPPLDEWEDIFEENMGPEGKSVARLQTIISCASPFPPLPSRN